MSHWFHRGVLKATTLVSFENVFGFMRKTKKLEGHLERCREMLLNILPDATSSMYLLNTAFLSYLSSMSGFFMNYKISGKKVRYEQAFKWTHSLLGQAPEVQEDAAYDVANMSINVAIWYMKHAAFVASKESIDMNDATEIQTSLKRAAAIFQMVQKQLLPIMVPGTPGSDLDPRVLAAYFHQCIAEAREVTVTRAIDTLNNYTLISALSNETSKMFETAEINLRPLDKSLSHQWSLYLQIKRSVYLAYAYCYSGKHLLNEDQCGEAIRALKESQAYYNKALKLCKAYAKVKGPVKPVKPDGHLFFTKINSTVTELLEKSERENRFKYHQKVPDFPRELEIKAYYDPIRLETYSIPQPAPQWEATWFESEELSLSEDSALKVG